MKDGIILINKPAGMTSFGVVARIRRVLSKEAGKKVKVGHTGTLDPFATGLMIIVVGNECRNAEKYSKQDKAYEATISLGEVSTTGDTEGEITSLSDRVPSETEISDTLMKFTGRITQQPPMFSAIKIGGKRAYRLAREGKEFEVPKREVTVYSLEMISYKYPELRIRANVSSGTYIRTLAEDIGKDLGVGAYCVELRRISIGERNVSEAQKLSDFGIKD